ncbi:hypothetical protein V2J09_010439 [Rumex salicifolius]
MKKKYEKDMRETSLTTTTTDNTDDGYSWKKYGQKMPFGSKFPRSYYRCHYKDRLGCTAVKKVQKLSEDPPCYKTVYKRQHTCIYPPSVDQCTVEEEDMSHMASNFFDDQGDNEWEDRIMMKMKGCYSIFFLLPDDYEFEEETLIQLWMAGEDTMDEHIGHRCFCSLLNGGYMIHSGTDHLTKKDKYKLNSQKMKRLLDGQDHNRNSYLKWESEWKNSNTTISNEIQHVSVLCDHIDATVFQTLEQLHELRTLLFLHDYGNKVLQIPDNMFHSLKKLETLDLSGTHIRKLSSFVGCMIHLKYLDLSRTLLVWLPDTICSLYELQTLKLRGCHKLRGLPKQLKRLTQLRHLDVDVVGQLATIIPRGIGSLVNLRTFSGFLVGDEDGCKIKELKELNSITGDFCIAMLENIGNADEAKEATLMKKQLLNKLQLRWTASQLSATDNNCYDVLECLQPCSTLKELLIFCYLGPKFPNWVGDPTFTRLVSLTFFLCVNVTELPLVEHLPCLEHLELVKMNGIKEIGRRGESDYAAFFKLEKLEINGMQSWETWRWEDANEGDYKSLVELTIIDCPELRDLHVLSSLCSIKHLELRVCSKLESLSDTKLPDSLENLIVEDCPRIKKKCLKQGGEDWFKVQHVSNISICTDDDDDDDDDNGDI